MALLALVSLALGPVGPVNADPGDGLITKSVAQTLAAGATAYTTTNNTALNTFNIANYGAVQIHVANVVTSTQVLTVVPQFSNAPLSASGSCSSVASWFTATTPLVYAASNITPTLGVVDTSFTVTASGVAGREVPVLGQCFRIKLDFSAAGQSYTPTVYIRAVNRQ
jgi:hypothetical protein